MTAANRPFWLETAARALYQLGDYSIEWPQADARTKRRFRNAAHDAATALSDRTAHGGTLICYVAVEEWVRGDERETA